MLVNALVTEHRQVAEDIFLMSLLAPEIAASAKAGQFIHIKCGKGLDPLLRRPFSLSSIDKARGTVSVIFEVRGRGTELLSDMIVGQQLDVLGPLGNSFFLDDLTNDDYLILVGGGIGAPPLIALAQALKVRGLSNVTAILGAAMQAKLLPKEIFGQLGVEVLFATDDGSIGHHGFVTDLLPQLTMDTDNRYAVFACGPRGMLQAVGDYCIKRNIPCQLSLEEVMACGVGACQGCVCKVKGNSGFDYVRVCRDGPVFKAEEVVWDD